MNKSNIEIISVDDLEGLIFTINEAFADWPDYIFRGHSQSDWLLEPTINRVIKKIKQKDKDELVKNHLNKFALEIRGRRGKNPKSLSENELWALGQHHGLHTPLLDWTQSPYVALFFALTNASKSSTGFRTIWALNSNDIETINDWYKKKYKANKKWEVELINSSLDENSRLVNQNGLFTKMSIHNEIFRWVENGPKLEWITLTRIDFPDKIRDKALAYLDLMNINYASLFPDLYGSSMSCNSKLEQTDFIEKKQLDHHKQAKKMLKIIKSGK
jgi:hypothetical protein